jgi:hypothetical protein
MKRRRHPPLWLLRDAVAFATVMATLWAMTLYGFLCTLVAAGTRKPLPASMEGILFTLMTHAEKAQDNALRREACRLMELPLDSLPPKLFPLPTTPEDWQSRWLAYLDRAEDMDAALDALLGSLATPPAAHGSTDATLRAAAHHESVGVVARPRAGAASSPNPPVALTLSRAASRPVRRRAGAGLTGLSTRTRGRTPVRTAHGSTDATRRVAAHHELVGAAAFRRELMGVAAPGFRQATTSSAQVALTLSRAATRPVRRRASAGLTAPSRRALAHARGPPDCRLPTANCRTPQPPAGTRPHGRIRSSR